MNFGKGGGYGAGFGFGGNDGFGMDGSFNNAGPGGFLPGSGGESSFNAGGGDSKRGMNPDLLPVTAAEIMTYHEQNPNCADEMKIGNKSIQKVTLVGQVKDATVSSTFVNYILDDKSGRTIEVKNWTDDMAARDELRLMLSKGTYVRVVGTIKSLSSSPHVVGLNNRPVKNFNEVAMHMMEVLYSHAYLLKKAQQLQGGYGAPQAFATSVPGAMPDMGGFGDENANYGAVAENPRLAALNPQQKQIYNAIRQLESTQTEDDGSGAAIIDVIRLTKLPEKTVRDIVEGLAQDGELYSTIDEDHYRTMNG